MDKRTEINLCRLIVLSSGHRQTASPRYSYSVAVPYLFVALEKSVLDTLMVQLLQYYNNLAAANVIGAAIQIKQIYCIILFA